MTIELTELSEIVRRILQVVEQQPVPRMLSEILESALRAFGCESGLFGYFDHTGRLTCCVRGELSDGLEGPDEDGIWRVAEADWPTLPLDFSQLESSAGDSASEPNDRRPGSSRWMGSTLEYESRTVGLIYLTQAQAPLTTDDHRWLSTLAHVVAPVLSGRLRREFEVERGQRELRLSRQEHRQNEQRYVEILDNTEAVIYVKDRRGRYLLINRQFELLFDVQRDRVVGMTDYDLFPEHMANQFRRNDEQVLESGQVLKCDEMAPHTDGVHTYVSIKVPLRDARNEIYGLAGISTDITERVRVERRLHEYGQQLELILKSIVEGIYGVDRDGVITFVNPVAGRLLGWDPDELVGQSQHVVFDSQRTLSEESLRNTCPAFAVLADAQPRHVTMHNFTRRDGSRIPMQYYCAPILEQNEVTGAVVSFRDLREQIQQQDYERELKAAEAVQKLLYPGNGPQLEGFEIAGAAFPAEHTCGDYFDFIQATDGSLNVVVGDVSGHGLGPALHMVQCRSYLRSMLRHAPSEPQIVSQLNELLATDLPDGAFVSMFLCRLEPNAQSAMYASAGHPAFLSRPDGRCEPLHANGPLLGLLDDAQIPLNRHIDLPPGSLLLLPTDGLMETCAPAQPDRTPAKELFGTTRMLQAAHRHRHRSARDIIHVLFEAAREFAQGEPQLDDITLVVIKVAE